MSVTETNLPLPNDLVESLRREADASGLSVPGYIEFLMQQRAGRLGAEAADAARFVFKTQASSLRKLAE